MSEVKSYQSQTINHILKFDDEDVKDHDIGIIRQPYLLEKSAFQTLSKQSTGLKKWAEIFLLISLGLFINILSKIISFLYSFSTIENICDKIDLVIEVETWEYISLLIAFGIGAVLILFSLIFRNEKEDLIRKIKEFFKGGRNG